METLADDEKLKNLMKQAIMEAIEEKKGVVHDLLVEVMEDVAMIRAIQEGENSGPAGKDERLKWDVPFYREICGT
jgi:hypothetical protein